MWLQSNWKANLEQSSYKIMRLYEELYGEYYADDRVVEKMGK